jgi:hypothetical protein
MAAIRRFRLGRMNTKYAAAMRTMMNRNADDDVVLVVLAAVVGVVDATRTEKLLKRCM